MNHTIYPLLFGGDINVYSVARAFHEAYGVISTCYGKYASGPASRSAIIVYHACEKIEEEETFRASVCQFAREHEDGTVVMVACGDSYVRLAAGARPWLPENCIMSYPTLEMIRRLSNKAEFYRLCADLGIDHPQTVVHRQEMGDDFDLPFDGPFICKPADSVTYWEHPFEGNDKVFTLDTREELLDTLHRCYAAGYPGEMIIQERIPGDDSEMRVLTCYSGKDGRVRLMCLGHVLLEEHTPHGLGNHAVILTEPDPGICESFREFLDGMGYVGFSNFDLKYDRRDGRYKAFEINCRQGRSNYYVTATGSNIARLLVEDLLGQGGDEGASHAASCDLVIADEPTLWSVVPRSVERDYIKTEYHDEMTRLRNAGRAVNPLVYDRDRGPIRRLWVARNIHGQVEKFATWYPEGCVQHGR